MEYIEKLKNLLENSHSPYSNYPVSSIVVMKDGKEFNGVNVENASYGGTICAERSAMVAAITAGYKKGDFKEMYLMSKGKGSVSCGICRQFMSEFFDDDTVIHKYSTDGEYSKYKFSDLMPHVFGSEYLK